MDDICNYVDQNGKGIWDSNSISTQAVHGLVKPVFVKNQSTRKASRFLWFGTHGFNGLPVLELEEMTVEVWGVAPIAGDAALHGGWSFSGLPSRTAHRLPPGRDGGGGRMRGAHRWGLQKIAARHEEPTHRCRLRWIRTSLPSRNLSWPPHQPATLYAWSRWRRRCRPRDGRAAAAGQDGCAVAVVAAKLAATAALAGSTFGLVETIAPPPASLHAAGGGQDDLTYSRTVLRLRTVPKPTQAEITERLCMGWFHGLGWFRTGPCTGWISTIEDRLSLFLKKEVVERSWDCSEVPKETSTNQSRKGKRTEGGYQWWDSRWWGPS